jgi:hypothetical protein
LKGEKLPNCRFFIVRADDLAPSDPVFSPFFPERQTMRMEWAKGLRTVKLSSLLAAR